MTPFGSGKTRSMFPIDEALAGSLAEALREAGTPAVNVRDLIIRSGRYPGAFDKALADGQTLIAWDVDFADAERFPLPEDAKPLIVRFDPSIPTAALVRSVASILTTLQDEGIPHRVLVLEPKREAPRKVSASRALKKAA